MQQMQPKLREYLSKLRTESYVDVQPGFVDSGSTGGETKPIFTAYAPPAVKKKKVQSVTRFDRSGRAVAAKAVVASPDTTGGRTITGPDATPAIDSQTGLASISPPSPPPAPGTKAKKIRREKIRFGQAPRNSLPGGADDVTPVTADGGVVASGTAPANGTRISAAPEGEAAGVTPVETANLADNPLTPKAPERVKTRFAATEKEQREKKVATVSAKQQEKAAAKPEAMTATEKASAQVQAAPLGVAGVDAAAKPKKVKKPKHVKGQPKAAKAPKERLAEKAPAAPVAAPMVAPTANPALAPTDVPSTSAPLTANPGATDDKPANAPKAPPTADRTTLPNTVTPPTTAPNPNGPPGTPPPVV